MDDALVELLFDPVRGAFLTTPNELPGPGRRREDGLEVIDRPASSTPTIAPLHAFDARNCCAGLTATPVLITRAPSRICRKVTRGIEDAQVGWSVNAPPPGRSASLGDPVPGPGDGTERGAPGAKGAKLRRRPEGQGRE